MMNLKIRRDPKLQGCAFANFGNSSGTEGEGAEVKRESNLEEHETWQALCA